MSDHPSLGCARRVGEPAVQGMGKKIFVCLTGFNGSKHCVSRRTHGICGHQVAIDSALHLMIPVVQVEGGYDAESEALGWLCRSNAACNYYGSLDIDDASIYVRL
ncbi:hypothetical protein MKW98_025758 [Papaver atlanticum]|uniref:Uncharacterized protein n=1 Tax=Papaver atlanticum TaxID=357466 RepID=A0AAD4XD25_9MAGN|nr:hypothetical protein MKW98_025758 [Papaver atlanticum]